MRILFHSRLFGGKGLIFALSILVGLVSALAALAMKNLCHGIARLPLLLAGQGVWRYWLLPAFPALGILLCLLFVRFVLRRQSYVKGLDSVIQSGRGNAELPFYHTYAHIFTSAVAVGLGGSAGLEAPSALTGSAIGANVAKFFRLGRESRILLLACGGAAGIAAVFDSPLAGTLFACEILLPAFSLSALVPLLLSAATAAVLARLLQSGQHFMQTQGTQWNLFNLHYYLLIGLACGIVSAYIIKVSLSIGRKMEALRSLWLKALLGAALLYVFFLLFPVLMGEGYKHIIELAGNQGDSLLRSALPPFLRHPALWLALLPLLFLLKPIVSTLSVESGGDGGIFGPSLFCGALLGYFAYELSLRLGARVSTPVPFICAGMGGILAGVMHAPLTGIFLVAELTGGFELLIPLMIVSSLSSFVSRNLAGHNLYKSIIAQKGGIAELQEESALLSNVRIGELMRRDFVSLSERQTLRSLLEIMLDTRQNIFPVLNKEQQIVGMIREEQVRPFFFKQSIYDLVLARDLMSPPEPALSPEDSLVEASRLFDQENSWHLPVCDQGKYLGLISKAELLDYYRNVLRQRSELF